MTGEVRVLVVDLSSSSSRIESLPEQVALDFIGGRGYGAYLLARYLAPGTDPLRPDNPLILSAGPAQGTNAFYGSHAVLTAKSPLTGIYLYSVSSGSIGHQLRKAGFSALVVTGKAAEPSYISVANDSVEIRSAGHIWGSKVLDAHGLLLAETGRPQASCAVIGPAGEKLIKMAAVVTEGEQMRTFGRGGGGCVMGSKNLKGIVIYGDRPVPVADEQKFAGFRQQVLENLKQKQSWAQFWRQYGTSGGLETLSVQGILPTRNWQTGVFDDVQKINGPTSFENTDREHVACAPYCPSPCSQFTRVVRGKYQGTWSAGPEYETLYVFGSNCGTTDVDAIIAAERLCDDYGLDTMSAGVAIGYAMECFEKGLLTKADTGGLDLRFGQHEAMLELLQRMADKKGGLPALLGEGVKKASQEISGSEGFAMHAKGLELGGYECRGSYGQAVAFAMGPRGGCHHAYSVIARAEMANGTGLQIEGKGQLLRRMAVSRMLYDSAVICAFASQALRDDAFNLLYSAFSSRPRDTADLGKAGLRIITLERMINVREGITRKDDILPRRLLEEPLPDGPNKGSVVKLEALLDEAYRAFGWDLETGVPSREFLGELGLEGYA